MMEKSFSVLLTSIHSSTNKCPGDFCFLMLYELSHLTVQAFLRQRFFNVSAVLKVKYSGS